VRSGWTIWKARVRNPASPLALVSHRGTSRGAFPLTPPEGTSILRPLFGRLPDRLPGHVD
jgi:hypothetical protein